MKVSATGSSYSIRSANSISLLSYSIISWMHGKDLMPRLFSTIAIFLLISSCSYGPASRNQIMRSCFLAFSSQLEVLWSNTSWNLIDFIIDSNRIWLIQWHIHWWISFKQLNAASSLPNWSFRHQKAIDDYRLMLGVPLPSCISLGVSC